MSYSLNSKIRDLKPYEPIQGDYAIRLDANESFRRPTIALLAKITKAVAGVGFNRYPDPFARELCRSFADFYGVHEENVTAGNGSDELISVILAAFLMKGEAVMTLSPDFSMYRFYSSLDETKCLEYQKKADFSVDVDELISRVKEYDVKALIFSNPCNPTGRGMTRDEVRRLVRSVNALVVLDEAYMDFWDQTMLGEAENCDNLIILRTLSKAFGMAAVRVGFAVANASLTGAIRSVKSPYNVNACSQRIGAVLLKEKEWVRSCIEEIKASRSELLDLLRRVERNNRDKIAVCDSVTNFVLVRTAGCDRVYEELLREGIVVRQLGDCLRITAGTTEENFEFIRKFEAVL